MEKTELVNNIVFKMQGLLDYETTERLKNVIMSELGEVILTDKVQLPSVDLYTDGVMIQKFIVDMVASGKEKSTIQQYVRALKNFLEYCGKSWNQVTGEDITTYLAYRTVKDKISRNYKDTLHTYIGRFFEWAYKHEYTEVDVMRKVERVKRTGKKIERITDDEVSAIKGMRKNIFYNAVFTTMIECGLRVSEIRDLQIENIDWKNKTISIWAEKTNEFRTVVLTSDLEYALKEYIGNRKTGCVFVSRRGGRLAKETIERVAKELGEDADCHCKTTVHVFRKTFASVLYRKTHDVLMVSRLLGHKDTAVTIRCYLKDDIEDIKHRRLQIS